MSNGMPTPADFQAGRVTNPGQSEIVRQRLYDYQIYPGAGTTQLSFFQSPIGQGLASALGTTAGTPKTRWDTNMSLGGQLPSGMSMLVESIEMLFWPGTVNTANTFTLQTLGLFNATAAAAVTARADDANTFYAGGVLEFNILQKNYLRETPLAAFPPKAVIGADAAIATNAAATADRTTSSRKSCCNRRSISRSSVRGRLSLQCLPASMPASARSSTAM